ncbi:hypothetical protein J2S53_003085 [Actinopolyspora lacussalsi]|nr:hypothetical protein [Actinopolyspora lacussalsi]
MSEPIRPSQTAVLDEPVDAIGVTAGDHCVERVIAARTLRAIAGDLPRGGDASTIRGEIADWLRQRANVITHGQWSV